eukprot:GDKJ01026324.1.p1 GENE.GDKJ01026324.1~~GDKJ01026324.1.p1  ORF type:complete len:1454 (+),score=392.63 GDKJ01026324.1:48-4364(+)
MNLLDLSCDQKIITAPSLRKFAPSIEDLFQVEWRNAIQNEPESSSKLPNEQLRTLLVNIIVSFASPPPALAFQRLTTLHFSSSALSSDDDSRQKTVNLFRNSPLFSLKKMFPTEFDLWNPCLAPPADVASDSKTLRALHKLNLQFLSMSDYLTKNLTLREMETRFALRSDIQHVVRRLSPFMETELERQTSSHATRRRNMTACNLPSLKFKVDPSGQAIAIKSFGINEVASALVGKVEPAYVKADVVVDLGFLSKESMLGWDVEVRRGSVLYLLALEAALSNKKENADVEANKEGGNEAVADEDSSTAAEIVAALGGVDAGDVAEVDGVEEEEEGDNAEKMEVAKTVDVLSNKTDEDLLSWPIDNGLLGVRGCVVDSIRDGNGHHLGQVIHEEVPNPNGDGTKVKVTRTIEELFGSMRYLTVYLDPLQYWEDQNANGGSVIEVLYANLNILMRRDPRCNGDAALLESVRTLRSVPHETSKVVPEWFADVLMGYGDPLSAHHSTMHAQRVTEFVIPSNILKSESHVVDTLSTAVGECKINSDANQTTIPNNKTAITAGTAVSGFYLKLDYPPPDSEEAPVGQPKITATPCSIAIQNSHIADLLNQQNSNKNLSSERKTAPPTINITLSPTQVKSVLSALNTGLTLIQGPPGTGKTDVAACCIQSMLLNFPKERILLVAHSNRALNDVFSKAVRLPGLDESSLVRLGGGANELALDGRDFSKMGRVDYLLESRLKILPLVSNLAKSLGVPGSHSASCETAANFFKAFVKQKLDYFNDLSKRVCGDGTASNLVKGLQILEKEWPSIADKIKESVKEVKYLLDLEAYQLALAEAKAANSKGSATLGRSARRRAKKRALLTEAQKGGDADMEEDSASESEEDEEKIAHSELEKSIKRRLNLDMGEAGEAESKEAKKEEETAEDKSKRRKGSDGKVVEEESEGDTAPALCFEESVRRSCAIDSYDSTVEEVMKKMQCEGAEITNSSPEVVQKVVCGLLSVICPFSKFLRDTFLPVSHPIDSPILFWEDTRTSISSFESKLFSLFDMLALSRPFELLHSAQERGNLLLQTQAKVVAMTCSFAAANQLELAREVKTHFDSIIFEEAGQISEIESFLPLLCSSKQSIKRIVMLGDAQQLPPVVTCPLLKRQSNLEQSLFERLIRLGFPLITLDAQGRSRKEIADLYRSAYTSVRLHDLPRVTTLRPFVTPNALFESAIQFVQVKKAKESRPKPNAFANFVEAEFAVALYMLMRLANYPAARISIITPYRAQKALIAEIIRQRCCSSGLATVFGRPNAVETVDRYQGQQNDFVILSMVRTSGNLGHLVTDHRRLIVALSRAALGLIILGDEKALNNAIKKSDQLHSEGSTTTNCIKDMCEKVLSCGTNDNSLRLRLDEAFPLINRKNEHSSARRNVNDLQTMWDIIDLKLKERMAGAPMGSYFSEETN